MSPSETPRTHGFTVEPSIFFYCRPRCHEHMPLPEATLLDDFGDAATVNWQSLWIDVGGEG
jgi:hypothetical protein